jgi:hypothetical protein
MEMKRRVRMLRVRFGKVVCILVSFVMIEGVGEDMGKVK